MKPTTYPIGFWNYVSAERQGPETVQEWADSGILNELAPNHPNSWHAIRISRSSASGSCPPSLSSTVWM